MKEEIKQLRVQIDGLAQLVSELSGTHKETKFGLKYSTKSRRIINCYNSLYLAKCWLGKCLAELGEENPYGSGYKTKEDIVPTQDVSNVENVINGSKLISRGLGEEAYNMNWNLLSHIEKVDWLRTEIEKIIVKIKEMPLQTVKIYNGGNIVKWQVIREFDIARTNTYTHLCEAKFHLGFELERIKNETV